MNKVVKLFNRYQERIKYNGPDLILIDGQKLQVGEIEDMAERKKPVTKSVLDNDVVKKNSKAEDSLLVHELSKHDFDSLISYLLKGPDHKAQIIRTATWAAIKRLRVKRVQSKARVKVVPGASSQGDAGSIVVWISKIQPEHKKSIQQLIIIDATAVARTA